MSMDSMLRTTAVLTGWVFSAAAVTLSMGGAIGAYSLANLFLASLALSVFISIAAIATPFLPRPSGFTIHARPARPTHSFKASAHRSYSSDYQQAHEDVFNHDEGHFFSWKSPAKIHYRAEHGKGRAPRIHANENTKNPIKSSLHR